MNTIAIVDFGGQYAHLIARRVRECGVYSEIVSPANLDNTDRFCGIIFSGGPRSVSERDMLTVQVELNKLTVPLLGICYGHQLIARLMGGSIEQHQFREYGNVELAHKDTLGILNGTPLLQRVWMSHGDTVVAMPDEYVVTASTGTTPIAAFRHNEKPIFGLQFHPEVTHTEYGGDILRSFVARCSPAKTWDLRHEIDVLVESIRRQAQGRRLVTLISGGIDSVVAFALCIKAVGAERLAAIHVDTGFMRLNESVMVLEALKQLGFENLFLLNKQELFFERLEGVTDPEVKRRIIGALFVEVLNEAMKNLHRSGEEWMLVQGTIYPDTIESGGTDEAATIKTHHNRVQEIEDLIRGGRIIEPLKEFYKDEVRTIAGYLGIPNELINRKPFPGPGLAIRIIADDLSNPDSAYEDEADAANGISAKYGLSAMILPVRSVGVQGDSRTYKHPVLVFGRGFEEIGWSALKRCAAELVNTLHTVNRVVYSPGDPPPWERRRTFLSPDTVYTLQKVDDQAQMLTAANKDIWQFPVIALPLYDIRGGQFFVLRPVTSMDAMTADVYEMRGEKLNAIIDGVRALTGAGHLLYDITTKPPSTIEWE